MLSRHAGSVQRGAWHMVLAARGADRKTAADGMRAIIDESLFNVLAFANLICEIEG
jgi:hypothetical protein